MIKKDFIKKTVLVLTVVAGLGISTPVLAKTNFTGEYRQGEILSFGSSLTKNEELSLRDYFGVSEDMTAIYVDNETAIKQLGLAPDALDNYTGGWYSSAYVKLTNDGGINVSSKNVSLVTNEMFTNALLTSGILNCEVVVSAPFMVTGESALAGILAGAEEIMGESLSEENKVVAKEEIDTTLEIADELLNNEENEIDSSSDSSNVASGIINDIKQQVIKDSPNSTQIQQIIINVTNNYGVELSEETNARVLSLMEDVNDLNIDYKDIEDTMKNIGDSISESLKEAGIKLKESGFLDQIFNFFSDLFSNFTNWIKGLFTNVNETASPDLNETNLPDMDSPDLNDINSSETDSSNLNDINSSETDSSNLNDVNSSETDAATNSNGTISNTVVSETENNETELPTEENNDSEVEAEESLENQTITESEDANSEIETETNVVE